MAVDAIYMNILGGVDGYGKKLSSTELITGNTSLSSTDLPTPLYGHCMVKINSSHVFIAGGLDGNNNLSDASYIYSSTTGSYTQQPDMTIARFYNACVLVDHAVGRLAKSSKCS